MFVCFNEAITIRNYIIIFILVEMLYAFSFGFFGCEKQQNNFFSNYGKTTCIWSLQTHINLSINQTKVQKTKGSLLSLSESCRRPKIRLHSQFGSWFDVGIDADVIIKICYPVAI